MSRYLSKSRFKEALECLSKLYYTGKKNEYANTALHDPFLEALAKGGFQVGELAKYYFTEDPAREGITIQTMDFEEALAETRKRLATPGRVVIAEGAFQFGNLIIRADIVVKEGNTLSLYEVKAKSASDENDYPASFLTSNGDRIASLWFPYLYDLAFQKYVIAHCDFSKDYQIKAHLMLANKDAKASISGLNQMFKIIKHEDRYKVIVPVELRRGQLGDEILKKINLDGLIDKIWNDFPVPNDWNPEASFEEFVNYASEVYARNEREISKVGKKCKDCSYVNTNITTGLKSGFHECWKIHTEHHGQLFEEPLVTELWGGKAGSVSLTQKLIDNQIFSLKDTCGELIRPKSTSKSGEGLSPYERRMLQVNKARGNDNSPYFDATGLQEEMKKWTYPLHMIDFETSMAALPFHQGIGPYQGIAFQFSHHLIHEDGTVEHKGQFLSANPGVYPNYEFVRALKQELEQDHGTIFRYHNHENTYLTMIAAQLETNRDVPDDKDEFITFIRSITRWKNAAGKFVEGDRNMVDLYELVLKYYYSPYASGSNSLKKILPAIIHDSAYLKSKYGCEGTYGKTLAVRSLNFDHHVWITAEHDLDPYKTLPQVFEGFSRAELDDLVKDFEEIGDGGAALTAYNYLQYSEVPQEQRLSIADSLLRYCELDTLAMVMIVEAWREWNP